MFLLQIAGVRHQKVAALINVLSGSTYKAEPSLFGNLWFVKKEFALLSLHMMNIVVANLDKATIKVIINILFIIKVNCLVFINIFVNLDPIEASFAHLSFVRAPILSVFFGCVLGSS